MYIYTWWFVILTVALVGMFIALIVLLIGRADLKYDVKALEKQLENSRTFAREDRETLNNYIQGVEATNRQVRHALRRLAILYGIYSHYEQRGRGFNEDLLIRDLEFNDPATGRAAVKRRLKPAKK